MNAKLRRSLLLCALLSSCVSYASALVEFDGLVGYDRIRQLEPARIKVQRGTQRIAALYRPFDWLAGDSLLEDWLAGRRQWTEVDRPEELLRERILELPALAKRDLFRLAEVLWRCSLVLERDPSVVDRRQAVIALGRCLREAGARIDPEALLHVIPDPEGFEQRARKLLPALAQRWPAGRAAALDEGGARAHGEALAEAAALPAGTPGQERALLRLLLEAARYEDDARVYPRAIAAVERAFLRTAHSGLRLALMDRAGLVREAAVALAWERGGSAVVPALLALMARNARRAGLPPEVLDPDAAVRRRVLHVCWQLSAEEADWKAAGGPSAFEVLHEAAVRDPDRSVATLARVVLAWLVRRPVDPDGDWIPAWWAARVVGGKGA